MAETSSARDRKNKIKFKNGATGESSFEDGFSKSTQRSGADDYYAPPIRPSVAWHLLAEEKDSSSDIARPSYYDSKKKIENENEVQGETSPEDDFSKSKSRSEATDSFAFPTKRSSSWYLLPLGEDSSAGIPRPSHIPDTNQRPEKRAQPLDEEAGAKKRKTSTFLEKGTSVSASLEAPTVSSTRCSECGRRQNSQPCSKCGSLPSPSHSTPLPPKSRRQTDETDEETPVNVAEPLKCSCPKCGSPVFGGHPKHKFCIECGCRLQTQEDRSQSSDPKYPQRPCPKCGSLECGGRPMPNFCLECGCPLRPPDELSKPSGPKNPPCFCPKCGNLASGGHGKPKLLQRPDEFCKSGDQKLPHCYCRKCGSPVFDGLQTPKFCVECGCLLPQSDGFSNSKESPQNDKRACLIKETELYIEESSRRRNRSPLTWPQRGGCFNSLLPEAFTKNDLQEDVNHVNLAEETEQNTSRQAEVPHTCTHCRQRHISILPETSTNNLVCPRECPVHDRRSPPKICLKCGRLVISNDGFTNFFDHQENVTRGHLSRDTEFYEGQRISSQNQSPPTCPVCKKRHVPVLSACPEERPISPAQAQVHGHMPLHEICPTCGCLLRLKNGISSVTEHQNLSSITDPLCRRHRVSFSSHTQHQRPDYLGDPHRSHSLTLHHMHPSLQNDFHPPNGTYNTAQGHCRCYRGVNRKVHDDLNDRILQPSESDVFKNTTLPKYENWASSVGPERTTHERNNCLSSTCLDDNFYCQPTCALRTDKESEGFCSTQPMYQRWTNEQTAQLQSLPDQPVHNRQEEAQEWANQSSYGEDLSEPLSWPPSLPPETYEGPRGSMDWQQFSRENRSFRRCKCSQPVISDDLQASGEFQRPPPQPHGGSNAPCACRRRSHQSVWPGQEAKPEGTKCRPVRVRKMGWS